MKKSILVFGILCLIFGGFFYFKKMQQSKIVKPVVVEKAIETKVEPIITAQPKVEDVTGEKSYKMVSYIFSTSKRSVVSNVEKQEMLDFFVKNGLNLNPVTEVWDNSDKKNLSTWDYDIGVADVLKFYELIAAGQKLTPIFDVTRGMGAKCTYNVNVVVKKDSKISSLKDLEGKIVATKHVTKGSGAIVSKAIVDEKIKIKKLFLNSDGDWMAKSLESVVIDAVIDTSRNYSNVFNFDVLGNYVGGKFEKYPNLKVAESKNLNVPCSVFFINERLREEERLKIINMFRKIELANNGFSAKYFWQLGAFSSIEEFPKSKWDDINLIFAEYGKKRGSKKKNYFNEIEVMLGK